MRHLPFIAAALVVLAVPAAAESIPAPLRMPGLWLMSTQMSDTEQRAPDYHFCVEPDTDAPLLNPEVDLTSCQDVRWQGSWLLRTVEANCPDEEGMVRLEGRFEGDFQYSYQGMVTLHYEPARHGVDALRLSYEGRRVAPCKDHIPRGRFLVQGAEGVGNLNLSQ